MTYSYFWITLENLEKELKTKELECKLYEPLEESREKEIIDKLIKRLEPYLDNDLDLSISHSPIIYNSDNTYV